MRPRRLVRAWVPVRFAIAVTLSLIYISITAADTIRIAAEARDPGVKRWISYDILGNRNHPFPIVYFSTQHFKTWVGEFLIVLPQQRYDVLSAYTQARIARDDCPGPEHVGDVWYTVRVIEHKKRTQRCVLPQGSACDYLSGVEKLSGINWTTSEVRTITDFVAEVRCNEHAL